MEAIAQRATSLLKGPILRKKLRSLGIRKAVEG
jgi:hypothetical protein